jgi:hypothetical protein
MAVEAMNHMPAPTTRKEEPTRERGVSTLTTKQMFQVLAKGKLTDDRVPSVLPTQSKTVTCRDAQHNGSWWT